MFVPGKTYVFEIRRGHSKIERRLVYIGPACGAGKKLEMFTASFNVLESGPLGKECFTVEQLKDFCIAIEES